MKENTEFKIDRYPLIENLSFNVSEIYPPSLSLLLSQPHRLLWCQHCLGVLDRDLHLKKWTLYGYSCARRQDDSTSDGTSAYIVSRQFDHTISFFAETRVNANLQLIMVAQTL